VERYYRGSGVSEDRDRLRRIATNAHVRERMITNLSRRPRCVRLSNWGNHDEGFTLTALAAPLNPYEAGLLEYSFVRPATLRNVRNVRKVFYRFGSGTGELP
jgi:hypothetical protein